MRTCYDGEYAFSVGVSGSKNPLLLIINNLSLALFGMDTSRLFQKEVKQ